MKRSISLYWSVLICSLLTLHTMSGMGGGVEKECVNAMGTPQWAPLAKNEPSLAGKISCRGITTSVIDLAFSVPSTTNKSPEAATTTLRGVKDPRDGSEVVIALRDVATLKIIKKHHYSNHDEQPFVLVACMLSGENAQPTELLFPYKTVICGNALPAGELPSLQEINEKSEPGPSRHSRYHKAWFLRDITEIHMQGIALRAT